ncbi:acetoacetate--CoA ligase [Microbacterium murale]|uniref:Acetoacetyl-CoA synthetase n=1 Tax=Microbacterium murale TaxID=1081040 RepID=A0ABQ1RH08_9MICO|nr:acetoacetate--CoA ligase [Microbacterium murale]GGD70092.1 acetoacetyl-CoA synthetase [Microbacterium murale]
MSAINGHHPDTLWVPSSDRINEATLTTFTAYARADCGFVGGPDYTDLWEWSVEDLERFWLAVWDFHGLGDLFGSPDKVLNERTMPETDWFAGIEVNLAEYVLTRIPPDSPAVIGLSEAGDRRALTGRQLDARVQSLAAALSDLGIGPGDVVAAYIPHCVEAVIAFLATAWVGATWTAVGQDYAANAVIDRFEQLTPKVLFIADGYTFGGRNHDRLSEAAALSSALTSVLAVIEIRHLNPARAVHPEFVDWDQLVKERRSTPARRVPFAQPLWVLFSSGTTGTPKGLVHGHGGVLVEMIKQLSLHWDLKLTDRVFWYTSPSWVMWNIQVGALCVGATVICYDGSPTWPDARKLWQLAQDEGATFLGVSPGYLEASSSMGISPGKEFDLRHLRSMGSTGAPLSSPLQRWAYEEVGELPLWSMSGGTDIAGVFAGGAATVPIVAGEMSVRCLGVALEAWSDSGEPLVGHVGELVVSRPMPSMPIAIWNDPTGEKQRHAYFEMFPGVWRHGDWVTVSRRGSVTVHGRSDSTLNRHGIRMGSADIYAALTDVAAVQDTLVLGIEDDDAGYWMPLFVVLADGASMSTELAKELRDAIRHTLSPRHVPDDIIAVPKIPRTRTGKRLEIPLKRIFQGQPVEAVLSAAAVDDITAVHYFEGLAIQWRGEKLSRQ